MYLQKNTSICLLHAISPVHAGSGSATGAVDLPLQRERHTGWPHIQASGVKGAFRDHCERVWMHRDLEVDKLVKDEKKERALELGNRIFGQSDGKKSQAGAVAFSDARLLAFPVRSSAAPFVWVVCPALLTRLRRDLELAGQETASLKGIAVDPDSYSTLRGKVKGEVILEDICLKEQKSNCIDLGDFFAEFIPNAERLLLIPDDHFTFLMETATEVQAQIKIKAETGTTQDGSLRYEELLPADTVLYTVVFFGDEQAEQENMIVLDTLKKAVQDAAASHIQIGGDMTLGRGIFKLTWKNQEGGAA
jgi:CRISPR-associated protein Cmr4